jgi:flagellar hook-length control protein FliK
VHPDITPIVQQQLNALATQTYVWQGQVWPGQNMQWEITEDDGRPRSGEDTVSGTWQTKLKLNLPNLGGIEARLGLDASGKLSIALKTNQPESQSTLQAAGSQLQEALQASGLQLNQLNVSHGEITG